MEPSRRGMPQALAAREQGCDRWGARLHPTGFTRDVQGDPSLMRRLKRVRELSGHKGQVPSLAWNAAGTLLVSAGEDARIKIWDARRSYTALPIEPGHTSTIYAAKFLPNTSDLQVISCSSDRQVRLIDLTKQAVRPFHCHHGAVKALAPLGPHVFLSGGDDGTVMRFDTRERASCPGCGNPRRGHRGFCCDNVLVEHHQEGRGGRSHLSTGINCIAIDPSNPNMFVTGGLDPIARLYDLRMLVPQHRARLLSNYRHRDGCVSCFIPPHLYSGRQPFYIGAGRSHTISGVAFSHTGRELVVGYCGDSIYSYSVADHAFEQYPSPPSAARRGASISLRLRSSRHRSEPAAGGLEHGETRPRSHRARGGGSGGGSAAKEAPVRGGGVAAAATSRQEQGPSATARRLLPWQQQQQQPAAGAEEREDRGNPGGGALGSLPQAAAGGTITFDLSGAHSAGLFGLRGARNPGGTQALRMTLHTPLAGEAAAAGNAPAGGSEAGTAINMVLPLRLGAGGAIGGLPQGTEATSVALSAADLIRLRDAAARLAQQTRAQNSDAEAQVPTAPEQQQAGARSGIFRSLAPRPTREPPPLPPRAGEGPGAPGSSRRRGAGGEASQERAPKRQRTSGAAAAQAGSGSAQAEAEGPAAAGAPLHSRPEARRRPLISQLPFGSWFRGMERHAELPHLPGGSSGTATAPEAPSLGLQLPGAAEGAVESTPEAGARPRRGLHRRATGEALLAAAPGGGSGGTPEDRMLGLHAEDGQAPTRRLASDPPDTQQLGGVPRRTRSMAVQTSSSIGPLVEDENTQAPELDSEGRDLTEPQFLRCFEGARNLGPIRTVAMMGSRSEFVVAGSDDGNVFIWDFATGAIVNILQEQEAAITGVAPHPFDPILATSCVEDTVQIWSPEAQEEAALMDMDAIVNRNTQEMLDNERHRQAPPVLMNMLHAIGDMDASLNPRPSAAAAASTSPGRCAIQ